MELLEKQIEITERIKQEAQKREEELLNALERRELAYIQELKSLCREEDQDEEQENELLQRLERLEKDYKALYDNQVILSKQLKKLESVLTEQLSRLEEESIKRLMELKEVLK